MNVKFISSVSLITADLGHSHKLFIKALGLPLHAASPGDDYFFSEEVGGAKHFGVWPLSQAAQACFGTPEWPSDTTILRARPDRSAPATSNAPSTPTAVSNAVTCLCSTPARRRDHGAAAR